MSFSDQYGTAVAGAGSCPDSAAGLLFCPRNGSRGRRPLQPGRPAKATKIATAGGGHFVDELRLQPVGYVKSDITDTHRMPVTGIRSSIVVHSRYQAALNRITNSHRTRLHPPPPAPLAAQRPPTSNLDFGNQLLVRRPGNFTPNSTTTTSPTRRPGTCSPTPGPHERTEGRYLRPPYLSGRFRAELCQQGLMGINVVEHCRRIRGKGGRDRFLCRFPWGSMIT